MTGEAEAQRYEGRSPKSHKFFSGEASTRLSQARTLLILPHLGGEDLRMDPVGFCYVLL